MIIPFLKFLWTLWPFVKEWAFGGKSVAEAYGENRRRTVFTLVAICFSVLGLWSTYRLVALGIESGKSKPECVTPIQDVRSTNAPGATVNETMTDIAGYLSCQENPKECDTP